MSFRRLAYTPDALGEQIALLSHADHEDILEKPQLDHFQEYFDVPPRGLGAKTMIIEEHYIDRDYLDDFVGYFAKCFKAPHSQCSRIHFFSEEITDSDFRDFLQTGKEISALEGSASYIGFMVVKPLPSTPIGRTCLRPYSTVTTGRYFPAIQECEANILGKRLLLSSLAFQEQDSEVGACATSALWTAFQGTSKLFNHRAPTPIEITRLAIERGGAATDGSLPARSFPAKEGLDIFQMSDAVRKVGLEPHCAAAYNSRQLQAELYAYIRAGIPVVLSIHLVKLEKDENGNQVAIPDGGHAVTVAGIHVGEERSKAWKEDDLALTASKIDKLYVHDDQIGPFARMELKGRKILYSDSDGDDGKGVEVLETTWLDDNGDEGNIVAIPLAMLVPLYPKVRLKFDVVMGAVIELDAGISKLVGTNVLKSLPSFEWDIDLVTNPQLKAELADSRGITGHYRAELLMSSLPKYIWRCRAQCNPETPLFEVLFDATDLEQGTYFLRVVRHDPQALKVRRFAEKSAFSSYTPVVRKALMSIACE